MFLTKLIQIYVLIYFYLRKANNEFLDFLAALRNKL